MKSSLVIFASLILLSWISITAHAEQTAADKTNIPLKDFARYARIMSPRLSPGGDYLAVRVDNASGDSHKLLIYRLSNMSVASTLSLPKATVPLNLTWVNNDWLVVAKGHAFGSLGEPSATGELISTDISGKHQRYLWGYKSGGRRNGTRHGDDGFGSIEAVPVKPNGHFYMTVEPQGNDKHSMLYDVDAIHNNRNLIADVHVHGLSFLLNEQGQPMFASGINNKFDYVAYQHLGHGWAQLDESRTGVRLYPFAYMPDQKTILADYSKDGGPMQLVSELENGSQRKVLASNDFSSISDLQLSASPEQPFAGIAETGKPKVIFIRPDMREAIIYKKVQQGFPGKFIDFINFSQDGGKLLFFASSDRDPGTYYILDTHNLKATKLFSPMQWIKPERMAERRPVRFKASDGMQLDGFLTLPPKRAEKNLPLVLMPHGGPHGIRDSWLYDNEAQFLASRGYLVLQVNYRGSGGRGINFVHAGYLKWGTRIQQDLIDGVKWTISQHYADPARVCSYGASFGGYAALMLVIRAPKMFKCAIGYDGIYDLGMMYNKGDVRYSESGRNYMRTVIGTNEAELNANSPDKLADKIQVPVFLIHGKDDQRAPYAQAKAMRNALEAAHKPVEWLVKSHERHGFYNVDNNVERMQKILGFLGKNIGKGAPVKI